MTHYVFDEYRHLTGFQMLFPDGEIKAAFLLTSVSAFTDRSVRAAHLRQFGLEEGVDFVVVNASELRDTVLGQDSMQGRRTVLSASGLMQLVFLGSGDFSIRMRHWMSREVIPSILRDGYYQASDVDAMVYELRERIAALELGLNRPGVHVYGDILLSDLIGTDYSEDN